jgi:hypothetical protein
LIKAEVWGKDWAGSWTFERWHIDGEMTDGTIFSTVNIDLTDIFGHAIIENGVLKAENSRTIAEKQRPDIEGRKQL